MKPGARTATAFSSLRVHHEAGRGRDGLAAQTKRGKIIDGEIVLLSATVIQIMRWTGQSKALATTLHGGGRRVVAARQALSSGQDAAGRGDDQPGADQDRDREPDRRSALHAQAMVKWLASARGL